MTDAILSGGGRKWLLPPTSEEKPRERGALIFRAVVSVSHSQHPALKMLTLICGCALLIPKCKYLVTVGKPGTDARQ